jgi:hypothetical protein
MRQGSLMALDVVEDLLLRRVPRQVWHQTSA